MFSFKDLLLPLKEAYSIFKGVPLWRIALLVVKYVYATLPAFLSFVSNEIKK